MDVDTFLSRIRKGLIELIELELNDLNSVRIQTTTWIRFARDEDRVELAFNSRMTNVHRGSNSDQIVDGMLAHRMTNVHRGSNSDQIVDGMLAHMKTQIENPALLSSRFKFNEVLFLDVDFHQLSLTRGSSCVPLPDWLANKKAIINPHNDDEECFKWAVIAAEKVGMKDPQRVSNLKKFADNYYWSGLEFQFRLKKLESLKSRMEFRLKFLW